MQVVLLTIVFFMRCSALRHMHRINSQRNVQKSFQDICTTIHFQNLMLHQSQQSEESMGYRFGDIARSLKKKVNEKAGEITGNDTYEFGDISRWADRKAKDRLMTMKSQTGEYKYEFGDLSRFADNFIKEKAAKYAGKENATDYQFGDVTKTLLKKILTGDYDAGCTLLPLAQLLPLNALFDLFEVGLLKDIGFRLLPVLATTIDARMKEALTGNANYELGDITKDRLRQYLSRFTGKETYEFGDITNAIKERQEHEKNGVGTTSGGDALVIDDPVLFDELMSWDQRYLESNRNSTVIE
jgi:hypothetical protein